MGLPWKMSNNQRLAIEHGHFKLLYSWHCRIISVRCWSICKRYSYIMCPIHFWRVPSGTLNMAIQSFDLPTRNGDVPQLCSFYQRATGRWSWGWDIPSGHALVGHHVISWDIKEYIMVYPICSIYRISTSMCPKNHPNAGKYSIHGAYAYD